jgi:hypothetical protein
MPSTDNAPFSPVALVTRLPLVVEWLAGPRAIAPHARSSAGWVRRLPCQCWNSARLYAAKYSNPAPARRRLGCRLDPKRRLPYLRLLDVPQQDDRRLDNAC